MRKVFVVIAVIAAILFVGCVRPPNYPGMVNIHTNELAFIIDMTNDGSAFVQDTNIQLRDIPIPGYFVRTGRFQHQGYWRPTLRVIAVSQAPVRREWDQTDSTQSVRMVSVESAGFVVPMIVNAYIANREDATKYLAAFRPVTDDNIDWSNIRQRDWHHHVKENAQPLERALDTVVYTRIMQDLSQLFVRVPILYAEAASKIFIPAIFEGMTVAELNRQIASTLPNDAPRINFTQNVSSIRDWALDVYGITITAMAPGDGVLYDSAEVQQQIDNLAIASMRERTLAQEQINAAAEQRVRDTQARTAAIEAQHQAGTIAVQRQRQEIENARMIAEATARAIEAGRVIPAGSFPTGLQSLIVTPHYNSLGAR